MFGLDGSKMRVNHIKQRLLFFLSHLFSILLSLDILFNSILDSFVYFDFKYLLVNRVVSLSLDSLKLDLLNLSLQFGVHFPLVIYSLLFLSLCRSDSRESLDGLRSKLLYLLSSFPLYSLAHVLVSCRSLRLKLLNLLSSFQLNTLLFVDG